MGLILLLCLRHFCLPDSDDRLLTPQRRTSPLSFTAHLLNRNTHHPPYSSQCHPPSAAQHHLCSLARALAPKVYSQALLAPLLAHIIASPYTHAHSHAHAYWLDRSHAYSHDCSHAHSLDELLLMSAAVGGVMPRLVDSHSDLTSIMFSCPTHNLFFRRVSPDQRLAALASLSSKSIFWMTLIIQKYF